MDNAGHLVGLAAECAVKHAVRRVAPNPPPIHFPKLTAEIRKFGGRNTVLYKIRRALSPPAHGSVFDDWSIAMRYRADEHVEDAQYRKWKAAAGRIMSAASIERRFSFDYDDEDAPHWAWPIAFDLALAELDPRAHPDQLTPEFVDRAFGSFLSRTDRLIVDSIE